mmetsp:Transcript_96574/g.273006  ORF Transcript_96574/g.273006 Transcript_96574/m.273006 type:complete len:213 (-) Transcript_96574:484-1122(-)
MSVDGPLRPLSIIEASRWVLTQRPTTGGDLGGSGPTVPSRSAGCCTEAATGVAQHGLAWQYGRCTRSATRTEKSVLSNHFASMVWAPLSSKDAPSASNTTLSGLATPGLAALRPASTESPKASSLSGGSSGASGPASISGVASCGCGSGFGGDGMHWPLLLLRVVPTRTMKPPNEGAFDSAFSQTAASSSAETLATTRGAGRCHSLFTEAHS